MSRRVVVLGVLVLIVGGWVAFRELPRLRNEDEAAARARLVFGEVPDVVDTVRIRQTSSETLLVREGDSWWMRSPVQEEVPAAGVRDLIARLATTEIWRRLALSVPEDEWQLYGLADDSPGRVRIELSGPEGSAGVDVGELTEGSRTAWVRRVGSDELWLCLEDIYNLANMGHQGLRDPRLFDVDHSELVRMHFTLGSRDWTAVRDDRGLWHLGQAGGERLRRWVVAEYAFTVAGLRADGYMRDDLSAGDWSAYGLDRPWGSVEWAAADGQTGSVWFGNELGDGLVFGRRSGLETVFRIAPEITPALEIDPRTLVDRNPIDGNFLRSVKIRVHLEDGYLDVVRQTPGVELVSDAGPLEPDEYSQVAGRNLQLGLEELQPMAEMIVPSGGDPTGMLDPVEGRLTVVWPDREVEIVIGRMLDGVWMAIAGEDTLWQIDPGLLLRLREVQQLR